MAVSEPKAKTSPQVAYPLIEWEFRYRHARGVETVRIKTYTEHEVEAREVAERYLQALATPSVRFVYVRLSCVATSAQHPDLVAEYSASRARATVELPIVGSVYGGPSSETAAKAALTAPTNGDEPASEPPTIVPPAAPMVPGESPRDRARRLTTEGAASGRIGS